MTGTAFTILFIVVGLLILGLGIAAVGGLLWLLSRRRQQAAVAAATRLGLTPVAALDPAFADPQWFIRGDQGRIQAICQGEHGGRPLALLESAFSIRTPRGARIFEQTVVALHDPGRALPELVLVPRGWSAMQRGLVRAETHRSPVPLSSDSPLASHYLAFSTDPVAAARLLNGPIAAALAAQPGWWIEGRGAVVFACRLDHLVSPGKLPRHLARAATLLETLLS